MISLSKQIPKYSLKQVSKQLCIKTLRDGHRNYSCCELTKLYPFFYCVYLSSENSQSSIKHPLMFLKHLIYVLSRKGQGSWILTTSESTHLIRPLEIWGEFILPACHLSSIVELSNQWKAANGVTQPRRQHTVQCWHHHSERAGSTRQVWASRRRSCFVRGSPGSNPSVCMLVPDFDCSTWSKWVQLCLLNQRNGVTLSLHRLPSYAIGVPKQGCLGQMVPSTARMEQNRGRQC